MVSKKKYIVTIVIVILLTGFVTFTFGNYAMVKAGNKVLISKDDFQVMKSFVAKYGQFESLINYADKNFLYDINVDDMLTGGMKGMLTALNDPYTQYMTKEEYNSLMEHTAGSFDGIGVYIAPSVDNRIMVISPIEDTPAEKAGIKPGDYIIKINDTEYTADTMDDAVKVMKGAPNTNVKITILRIDEDGNQKSIDLDIVRDKIRIVSVKSKMLEDKIGYIRITTFDQETAIDFKNQYTDLKNQGMKGIIVDLRQNGGGLIDSCVEITDMFLGEGYVTYTQTKSGEREYYNSDADKIDIPLVLLVDGGSASASEIMSGAVKDTKSGTLIGTKTFGKGIVQRISRFGTDGGGVKMTISEYFTPSGVNIHGIGIEPDILIELPADIEGIGLDYMNTDNQLQKGIEVIKQKMN